MLVLSRGPGSSLIVDCGDEVFLVKVLALTREGTATSMQISRTVALRPGAIDIRTIELARDETHKVGDGVEIVVVDLRGDRARLGIDAPRDASVHRLEVYEAIMRENGEDPDDGLAGSRVPRPTSPKPPSLDVRLDEPRSEDEDVT